MRDYAFILFLLGMFGCGVRRPFVFVLMYIYIDLVSPQRLTYLLLNSIPISLIAVGLAVGGWIVADNKQGTRLAPRQALMIALLAYCAVSTRTADFPVEALEKWDWAWKALAFAIFLPFTLRTRLRIEALLAFMILSAASIIIVGGIKTLFSGGGYGALNLMVTNNTGLYEGSIISTVAIAIIPLIWWFAKHGTIFPPDRRVTLFCLALTFACLLIPIGTVARTGLVCIAVLALLTLRAVKRRLLYLTLFAAIGLTAIPFLPDTYTQRMGTIGGYQGDASASTRLAVWQWTWDYVQDHPFGGGFEAYRQNRIRYDTVKVEGDGTGQAVVRDLQVDQARAYHSSYFEMLGEQGFPGLALWLMIQIGGLFRMEVLRRRYLKSDGDEAWVAPLATALQHCHLIYLIGGAFVGIALNPFLYLILGAQIGLDTYLSRRRAGASATPMGSKPKPQLAMQG